MSLFHFSKKVKVLKHNTNIVSSAVQLYIEYIKNCPNHFTVVLTFRLPVPIMSANNKVMFRVPLFCKIFRFSIVHDASTNEMKIDLSVQLCIDGYCENMNVLDDGRMSIPSCDANFGDFDYELSGIHYYYFKTINVPNQMSPYLS